MGDPFTLRIEPGQTELDLRPVLMPLLQRLARLHGCGIEKRLAHEHNASPHHSYSPEQIERFMDQIATEHRLATRLSWLTPEGLHRYLTDRGWHVYESYRHRQYSMAGHHAFCVRMCADDEFPGDCWNALRCIAEQEGRKWSLDRVATDILAYSNAIDALASVETDDVEAS